MDITKLQEIKNRINQNKMIKSNKIYNQYYMDSDEYVPSFIQQIPLTKNNTGKVMLCCIGKMENKYIREFVEYHKNIGFDNICLYDNNDINGERFEDVIDDYIKSGFVILKNYRGKVRAQIQSYTDCYNEYFMSYDWIAFFDIDEFLELSIHNNVKDFLNQKMFDNYNCVRICWKQYTDNGLIYVKDDDYSVNRFTEVLDNKLIKKGIKETAIKSSSTQSKAFIRTSFKHLEFSSPHGALTDRRVKACNAYGKSCPNAISIGNRPIWVNAWLNHYRFKSLEEFISNKMVRLWPTHYGNGGKDMLNLNFYFQFNEKTNEKIEAAKALKKKYGIVENAPTNKNENQNEIYVTSWIHTDDKNNILDFNWGDDINFFFLEKITNKKHKIYKKTMKKDNFSLIGSILSNHFIDGKTTVWGSGILDNKFKLRMKPKKICAVRGPLTRQHMIDSGIKCPEIYGDPALLLPYYYNPDIEKKYKIGFIPHHSCLDKEIVKKFAANDDVLLIKLKNYGDWKNVIDQIKSCEFIVSESLHGLITAEAYNIPNLWVKVGLEKQDLKFHDFFLSLGKDRKNSYVMNVNTSVDDVLKECEKYEHVNNLDLQPLIDACPFKLNIKL